MKTIYEKPEIEVIELPAVTVLISASVDGTAVLLEEDDATLESLILEGD